jgi:hypothetical protein
MAKMGSILASPDYPLAEYFNKVPLRRRFRLLLALVFPKAGGGSYFGLA